MENILNYIEEERKVLAAEEDRKQKENAIKATRLTDLESMILEKLNPLKEFVIDGHKCDISTQKWGETKLDIKIQWGKSWTPKYESYTMRNDVRIKTGLYDSNVPLFTIEADFLYHVSDKAFDLTLEECLMILAKYFALRVKNE